MPPLFLLALLLPLSFLTACGGGNHTSPDAGAATITGIEWRW